MVEGADDFNLLFHFVHLHKLVGVCTVIEGKGIDDVLDSLRLRLRLGDVERIGIVVDADEAAQPRWESIRSILISNGYDTDQLPPSLSGNGTIIRQIDLPTVGVWVMPDNFNPGMVENFVEMLIPQDDVLWPVAARCVDNIAIAQRRFIPEHLTKAKIHTWLAWQQEPGKPIGQALRKKYFDGEAAPAVAFASWMRTLFSPTTV